ncbi:hypothetical protein BY458DRAFT_489994 [Sporodiniella umbellata]|nr:hypothetical protein BY458DRAFT_489994 [Sporodiniella umbellata]
MFEPTIKYKRVNETTESEIEKNDSPLAKEDTQNSSKEDFVSESLPQEPPLSSTVSNDYVFKDEESTDEIQVDPDNNDRIIVTLSTGKQYTADRYCPHAGADLSYHGKLAEFEYPSEIGPIVMCQFHYWEFALERNGDGFGGKATINACPIKTCSNKLDW